jgi:hypothetical protein
MKGRKLFFVVALVALVVVAVVAVAWAAPVGVGGDRQRPTPPVALKCQSGTACGGAPVAAEYPSHIRWPGYECQSGHACGGAPLAAKCQSGHACGGMPPNASAPHVSAVAVWPLPGGDAMCQSGTSCGG